MERVQRWYRHLEQAEFSLVSITAVGHGGEKLARSGQEGERVAVGEHRGRHFCRALEVSQRTLGVSRQPILLGDLRRNRVGVPGPEQFECLGEPAVQQPTPCWGDSVIGRATQQIMREVVAIPDLPNDPPPPQLVDSDNDSLDVEVAGLGQQRNTEVAPKSRCKTGHLPPRGTELLDPLREDPHPAEQFPDDAPGWS